MDTWKQRVIIKLLSAKFRAINAYSSKRAAAGSVDVLIYPMQGKAMPRDKGKHRFVKSNLTSDDGLNIQVYDWGGDGATTLLIHGWDSNSIRWAPMIDQLGIQDHRWVALDAPYHGKSGGDQFNMLHYKGMIRKVVEKYQPEYIVSHSLGCLALSYYLQRTNYTKLKKLLLICPVADLSWHIDRYHQLLSLPKATRPQMDHYFEAVFNMKFEEFNMKNLEERLDCEVTIIHSEDDAVVPISDGMAIHNWIDGSNMIPVQGFGHAMQHKDVYDLVQRVLA